MWWKGPFPEVEISFVKDYFSCLFRQRRLCRHVANVVTRTLNMVGQCWNWKIDESLFNNKNYQLYFRKLSFSLCSFTSTTKLSLATFSSVLTKFQQFVAWAKLLIRTKNIKIPNGNETTIWAENSFIQKLSLRSQLLHKNISWIKNHWVLRDKKYSYVC